MGGYRQKQRTGRSRGPESIANILSELMARRGLGRVQAAQSYEAAWQQAAGPLAAQYTRVGALKRGTLEILVANSTLLQEFTFQKAVLLAKLTDLLPDQGIGELRFRVGTIS